MRQGNRPIASSGILEMTILQFTCRAYRIETNKVGLNRIYYKRKESNMAKYKYLVVVEKARGNYSAYVPDLPVCVTTGKTVAEIHNNTQEAIKLHLEGMRRSGEPIPVPAETTTEFVEVNV